MFCPNCGKQIPERAKFCPECGHDVAQFTSIAQEITTITTQNPDVETETIHPEDKDIRCPNCGSNHCKEHYKQNIASKGGGYGCIQGGLGFLLAGPFGLLCGLCGRSTTTTTTNTLVWVCQDCGKEFRSHMDVYEGIKASKRAGWWILIIFGALADTMQFIFGSLSGIPMSIWLIGLAFSSCVFVEAHTMPKRDIGVKIKEFLSESEKKELKDAVRKLMISTLILAVLYVVLNVAQWYEWH